MVGTFPALSETFVLNQITGLIDRGHSVSIFAERRSTDSETHPDVETYGLRSLTRYELLPDNFVSRVAMLPTYIRANAPFLRSLNVARYGSTAASLRLAWSVGLMDGTGDFDIVQCHFGALGVKAALLRDVGALRGKIVTAFHGEDITNYPRRFAGNVYAPLFAHGDLFLPISARWNDQLVAMGCPADRIRVHRMGVDLRYFAPGRGGRVSDSTTRLVSVARLVEKKGIADAIRAVARLRSPVAYTIVGDGPLRQELESLAQSLNVGGRVRFTGALSRTKVVDLLGSADIVLAPSVTGSDGDIEGIPVSIMEAMAVGVPVISTHHSAIDELVSDGVSGYLVQEHDVPALADRIDELAGNPARRAEMGMQGRATIEREFDAARLTEKLESMYTSLLA